jgi:hypothetical protein
MAKRSASKDGINKSASIRDMLNENPKAPVKEIVSILGDRGIKVSPNLVYILKSKMKHKTRRARRQRAVDASQKAGLADPVQLIVEVRRVAEKAGGIRRLKALVDLLAE